MKKNKLSLKKITVSNLSEDYARKIFGGDPGMPTYNDPGNGDCTDSCTANNCQCHASQDHCHTGGEGCASGPEEPNCTRADGGCTEGQTCPSNNNKCFSDLDCSVTQCTDVENGCPATYKDLSCANGPESCNTCNNC
ncbi:MAG: hypothetical protein J7621_19050 [Niastella sp.]|nr:hypothetical protein [Niastella sp.]